MLEYSKEMKDWTVSLRYDKHIDMFINVVLF